MMTKRYRSEALAAAHEAALGLAEAGVMSRRTMRAFDPGEDAAGGSARHRFASWVRRPRAENLRIDLGSLRVGTPVSFEVPASGDFEVVCLARPTRVRGAEGEVDARAVSVFAVNRRAPAGDDDSQDTAFAFQVEMSVTADRPFVPRYDPRGLDSGDWDDRLADLHYRDAAEYAVGHNVSTRIDTVDGECRQVQTEWMPRAAVERVEPSRIPGVELGMEALGALNDAADARRALSPLVRAYRDWIEGQREGATAFSGRRREVADKLVSQAAGAADRIQAGIDLLDDPDLREAFRIANRAMAAAARRRSAQEHDRAPAAVDPPAWRPFQLAYLLMNLRGIAEPTHCEREIVDLLFFPTGGGKTEAYLGLAAFTLVLRRLRDPDPGHRGLSVLMRYTLWLLTLDQLGRAATPNHMRHRIAHEHLVVALARKAFRVRVFSVSQNPQHAVPLEGETVGRVEHVVGRHVLEPALGLLCTVTVSCVLAGTASKLKRFEFAKAERGSRPPALITNAIAAKGAPLPGKFRRDIIFSTGFSKSVSSCRG